jgi:predicted TIM-barrel fold metal-dependent hydrolase
VDLTMIPCPPPDPDPSRPKIQLPDEACDSHCHILGPAARFPYSEHRAYNPPDAPKEELFALHRHLGISRAVIVQASCHGLDNSAMVEALETFPETTRGIANLPLDCTEEQIAALDRVGVRGARFNFMSRILKAPPLQAIDRVLERIAPFGWHAVLHFDAGQIPELKDWIAALSIPHVVDHMGRLCGSDYGGEYFDGLCSLMERDLAWMKISGAERGSELGDPFSDMVPIARALVEIAPDRTLWGTDWPHPVLTRPMPDDGHLVDLLLEMVPDEATRNAVLVDNPARLYGF